MFGLVVVLMMVLCVVCGVCECNGGKLLSPQSWRGRSGESFGITNQPVLLICECQANERLSQSTQVDET